MPPRPSNPLAIVAVAGILSVVCLTSALRAAQPPARPPSVAPAAPAPAGQKASEKYTNLKVLGDLPASQIRDAMVFMSASLGVGCDQCHVRTPEGQMAFEKDDKEEKVTARKMLQLTQGLNKQYFDGQQEVSCATCHQGRRAPIGFVPVQQPMTADQLAAQKESAGLPPGTRPPAPKETADQILAKYYEAIGGEAAAQKVTSAVMRGTSTNRMGVAAPVVVTEKAPGRVKISTEMKTTTSRSFDGTKAWMVGPNGARELEGIDVLSLSRDTSPWIGAALKPSQYTRLQVGRYDKIDGHDVVSLNGNLSPDVMESLSFDRESGLLLRRVSRLRTPLGRLQVQFDYADYRPVDGVKVPFDVKISAWDSVSSLKFTDVKLNAPVEDDAFGK